MSCGGAWAGHVMNETDSHKEVVNGGGERNK